MRVCLGCGCVHTAAIPIEGSTGCKCKLTAHYAGLQSFQSGLAPPRPPVLLIGMLGCGSRPYVGTAATAHWTQCAPANRPAHHML